MRSILLYHIYPINHWKDITAFLFQKLPFQRIIIHVSLPNENEMLKQELEDYFKNYPVNDILYSLNSGKGEVDAMKKFVQTQDLKQFDILTYMHCKGVSKPDNKNISDWTRLMHYFIIEKMNICKKVFKKGFTTFGVNKSVPDKGDEGFRGCNFYYEGNFVSLNLKKVNLKEAVEKYLENSYYGLEGFWGKTCSYKEGYSIFDSGINHYLMPISEQDYKTTFARFKYNLIKQFYTIRAQL